MQGRRPDPNPTHPPPGGLPAVGRYLEDPLVGKWMPAVIHTRRYALMAHRQGFLDMIRGKAIRFPPSAYTAVLLFLW